MPAASRYKQTEDSIVQRVQAQMPTDFRTFAATRRPMEFEVPTDGFPAFLVFWRGFRKAKANVVAQVARELGGVLVGSLVLSNSSDDADSARDLVYSLQDGVRAALLGFQPTVAGLEAKWPMELDLEHPVRVEESGEYGVYSEWLLPIQFSQGVIL